jgi:glycosyltransferase involved in cell wall biosynthesis/GT2 family glycosyltransferase
VTDARAAALEQQLDRLIAARLADARAELDRPRPPADPPAAAAVDVVIPVHDAAERVEACLASVCRHTGGQHRILVIDDASGDPRIAPLLQRFQRERPGLDVQRNPVNLGYLASVNPALKAGARDVVLLNSDTQVGPQWLDRLAAGAYSAAPVGIACPVTDQPGPLGVIDPERLATLGIDAASALVRQSAAAGYPLLPVAVGFCMYLRRAMLARLGGFDPAFAPGYGEENDLSMRAWRAGFAIVACPDVLVGHSGSASFGHGAAIERRRALNAHLVGARWPGHDALVRGWWADWPLRSQAVRLAQADDVDRPGVLHVLHRMNRVGGTELHTRALAHALSDRHACTLIAPERMPATWADLEAEHDGSVQVLRINDGAIRPNQKVLGAGADLSDPGVERRFARLLAGGRWPLVHIHSLLHWNSLLLPQLARDAGAAVVLSLHSLESLCADFTLVPPPQDRPCGRVRAGADPECARCLAPRMTQRRGAPLAPIDLYLASRHHFWRRALDSADAIVAPSRFVRDRVVAAFGAGIAARIEVVAHGLPVRPAASPPGRSDPTALVVGFLGGGAMIKGAATVLRMAAALAGTGIVFRIIGVADFDAFPAELPANVVLDGPYAGDELAGLLRGLDLVVMPSVVEETFSLLLSECRAAGVPVVASAHGAFPERIRDGVDGWLAPVDDPQAWAARLRWLAGPEGRLALARVRDHLGAQPVRTLAENADDYAAIYRRVLPAARMRPPASAAPGPAAEGAGCRAVRAATRPEAWPPDLVDDLPAVPARVSAAAVADVACIVRVDDRNAERLPSTLAALDRLAIRAEILDQRASAPEAILAARARVLAAPAAWYLLIDAGDQPTSPLLADLAARAADDFELVLADHRLMDAEQRPHQAGLPPGLDPLLALTCAEPPTGLCVRGDRLARLPSVRWYSPALAYAVLLMAARDRARASSWPRVGVVRADRNLGAAQDEAVLAAHREVAEEHRGLCGLPGSIVSAGTHPGWQYRPASAPPRAVALRVWGPAAATTRALAALRSRPELQGIDVDRLEPGAPVPACERLVLLRADVRPAAPDWLQGLLGWLELPGVALVAPRRQVAEGVAGCGWRFDGGRLHKVPEPSSGPARLLADQAGGARAVPGLDNACLAMAGADLKPRDLQDLVDPDPARAFLAQQPWRGAGRLLWSGDARVEQLRPAPAPAPLPPGVRQVLVRQGLAAIQRGDTAWPDVDARRRPLRGAAAPGGERRRVAALTRDHWAPSRYRIDLPLADLVGAGAIAPPAVWRGALEPLPGLFELAAVSPDVVLFHDALGDDGLELMIALARHLPQVRRVLIVDDLLDQLPPGHPARGRAAPDIGDRLRRAARAANLTVVTSAGLAAALELPAERARVIDNALPDDPWRDLAASAAARPAPAGRVLRVGWVGAQQHAADLALIDPVVRARPQLQWVFLGMAPPGAGAVGAECHPMVPFDRYPQRLAELQLDVALVPLVDHPFNRSKSRLKLLELGALGIAVVASDLPPYRDAPVRHAASAEDWLSQLDQLTGDPVLCAEEGSRLQHWVLQGHMAGHRRDDWLQALVGPLAAG